MNARGTPIDRRELLGAAWAAGTAAWLAARVSLAADAPSELPLIDSNVSLFQWPFRRLPLDEPERLVHKLQSLGIREAWAGSFEGLLHRDLAGVNARLAEVCARFPILAPIGTVNPALPDWTSDLQRCLEVHQMPGVRVYPNYHGYTCADPRFRELLERSAAARRFVQIVVALEDVRTQHPLVRVADVDLTPLPEVLRQVETARVQLLNGTPRGALLLQLAELPGVSFDTARVEGTDGVANLLRSVPAGRVLFGSHAPFLIPEAALIRIGESPLTVAQLREVLWENARRMRAWG